MNEGVVNIGKEEVDEHGKSLEQLQLNYKYRERMRKLKLVV